MNNEFIIKNEDELESMFAPPNEWTPDAWTGYSDSLMVRHAAQRFHGDEQGIEAEVKENYRDELC